VTLVVSRGFPVGVAAGCAGHNSRRRPDQRSGGLEDGVFAEDVPCGEGLAGVAVAGVLVGYCRAVPSDVFYGDTTATLQRAGSIGVPRGQRLWPSLCLIHHRLEPFTGNRPDSSWLVAPSRGLARVNNGGSHEGPCAAGPMTLTSCGEYMPKTLAATDRYAELASEICP
jgi:hypothetical protein